LAEKCVALADCATAVDSSIYVSRGLSSEEFRAKMHRASDQRTKLFRKQWRSSTQSVFALSYAAATMASQVSRKWAGYWQRSI
jgi:hypothetical protein